MGHDLREWEYLISIYKPYPTIFPLHLDKYVFFIELEFGGRATYMETHPK